MTTRLFLLTSTLAAVAVASIATLPAAGLGGRVGTLVLLVVLAASAGVRTVHIPRLEVRVTVSDVFVLAALVVLTPLAVPIVAMAAVAGAVFGPGRGSLSLRTVFNLVVVPLSAAAAAWADVALGSVLAPSPAATIGSLFAAVAVYAATNLILVVFAMRMATGRGIGPTLVRLGGCVALSALASLLLALGLVPVLEAVGPIGFALGLSATGPLAAYARIHKMRNVGPTSVEAGPPETAAYVSTAGNFARHSTPPSGIPHAS